MVKKIKIVKRYTCPECHCRPWSFGIVNKDQHHCMCSDGFWEWNGETWVWVGEEITETGGKIVSLDIHSIYGDSLTACGISDIRGDTPWCSNVGDACHVVISEERCPRGHTICPCGCMIGYCGLHDHHYMVVCVDCFKEFGQ